MKYHTISTSSLASERPKSTLTIYADMDLSQNKMLYTEDQVSSIRGELEIVQKALKLQTRRCRQLVAEYTRRLQEKEQQYHNERTLRDNQLAKVLRALLIFEARLKQEQKFISHQLNEKDYIINKQKNHIKKLLSSNLFCKNCNNAYVTSPVQESLDSSSEYYVGESNLESLDSSSIYSTLSDKGKSDKSDEDTTKYKKNNSGSKKIRKLSHKKSNGTYFEVLKLRNESNSPFSNEDNTSNDYDNLDSLPTESITSKINWVSDNIEAMFTKNKKEIEDRTAKDKERPLDNPSNLTQENVKASEDNFKDLDDNDQDHQEEQKELQKTDEGKEEEKPCKITESIQVFEGGNDEENNENWYASASDQEDDTQRNIYRNNPVLECMNQILLQNINDPLNSPPKTPSVERKNKNNKRVKFSDEEDAKEANTEDGEAKLTKENLKKDSYYETPIQKTPNFYETPQSIYSNDYEQILSSKEDLVEPKAVVEAVNHFYVDMEAKAEENLQDRVRKSKILRAPPALPPKPTNLVSKYKLKPKEAVKVDLEPDYCSISELNLPTKKGNVSFKKINVVAEINLPTSNEVKNKLEKAANFNKNKINDYDPVIVNNTSEKLVVKKCVEKLNIQIAKQTNIKDPPAPKSPSRKATVVEDVPKLPQVSEIIIPEDEEEEKKEKERITQDNYVKNNSQILKYKMENRRPMYISSISNLINNFNGKSSDKKKSPVLKSPDKFSGFDSQNFDKLQGSNNKQETLESTFDLSQNFEEFKLDDCEIEEYDVENADSLKDDLPQDNSKIDVQPTNIVNDRKINADVSTKSDPNLKITSSKSDLQLLEVPRLNKSSIELLKKQLQLSKGGSDINNKLNNETNYEHFLECTGLSSKSILTPSRLLSNHKSMLKPKDVKLRSKTKNERNNSGSSIKYWSEPYI